MSPGRPFRSWLLVAAVTVSMCSGEPLSPIACPRERPLVQVRSDHLGSMWFCSEGASLAGDLHRPGTDPTGVLIVVPGSGEARRLEPDHPLVTELVDAGLFVLTYDKRGVGASQGDCCPDEAGDFGPVIGDTAAAIRAVQAVPALEGLPLGVYGEDQAVWVAPAASDERGVQFLVMASAPPVSAGVASLHGDLTRRGLDEEEIAERLDAARAAGPDPRSDIAGLPIPMLWVYGSEDAAIPVELSRQVLAELAEDHGLDLTVELVDGAGHVLGRHPGLPPIILDWLAGELGIGQPT